MFIIAGTISYFIIKKSKIYIEKIPSVFEKIQISFIYFLLFGLALWAVPKVAKAENSANVFTNELQANGIYRFYLAFVNSELDYFKFYKTLPENEAYALLAKQLPNIQGLSTTRSIQSDSVEIHKNVVLITIESYSADFMKMYGSDKNITPFLDDLATKSLIFTNLYALEIEPFAD